MDRGGAGARSLNIELQAALNPAGDRKVERFGWTFAPGDKVMRIENEYEKEVYNGDIGTIDEILIRASSLPALMAGPSHTDLANSTCWCPPTLRPFTKARVRNIPP
jgi:exodeoxyribonuclease V alpha subunit